MKKPAKVMKAAEGERHHAAPAKADKLPIKVVMERIEEVSKELGMKVPKGLSPAKLREELDNRLRLHFAKKAPELAQDPDDCFGKPDMRDPKNPECMKCAHLKSCGEYVDKALAKMKNVVVNATDEADAEEEAADVKEEDVPKSKTKTTGRKAAVAEFLKAKAFKEWPDFEVEILYKDERPDLEGYDDATTDFIKLIYKKKPSSMSAWRKETMAFMKSSKAYANEDALALLTDMLDFGVVTARRT